MKKYLFVLFIVLISSAMLWGQYDGNGTFEKVEDFTGLESGGYYVFYGISGSYNGAMTNTVSTNGRLANTAVTITENNIINPSESIVWRVDGNATDGYTVYNEAIEKYAQINTDSPSGFSLDAISDHIYKVSENGTKGVFFRSNSSAGGSRGISIYENDWRSYLKETAKTLHLYKLSSSVIPTTVATPVFTPGTGTYFEEFDVTIATATDGATIYYTLDGTDPTDASAEYTSAITVSTTTTVKAIAYAAELDPSHVATAVYTFPTIVDVADIASLRTGATDGTIYRLTGEAILTFQQNFRNQKYIQDNTAGILIDDQSNVLTTPYDVGDGITGLVGTLNEYGNMTQLVPFAVGPAASSTGNTIIPEVVTISELTDNFDNYESELVVLENITFPTTGNFTTGEVFQISDGTNNFSFRTTFYDVDYVGGAYPQGLYNITVLPNSRADGDFVTARNLNDIVEVEVASAVPSITNIVQTPDTDITSTTDVVVSADVTASDGRTIEGVELNWGTVSGSLTNNIDMAILTGDTYTATIPAQAHETTVYYEIYAMDNVAEDYTTPEQSYTVQDPTVADPTFTPLAGLYYETQEVTLSCTTEGADIYYSIDYVDPELTDVLLETYTTPFLIDSDCTIEAWAELTGYIDSQTVSATYTFMEATDNLVVNGGFENWNDATTPTGWDTAENVGQETVEVYNGNYSVKQTAGTKNLSQDVSGIVPGQTYTISYWYLDNSPDARTRAWSYWLVGASTITENVKELRPNIYSTDNPEWQQFSHTLVAPPTANGFRFEVRTYNENSGSGVIYYDDFTIVEVTGGEPVPLVADFSANLTTAYVGQEITFTNLTVGGVPEYLYEWNFGDSNTSSEANPIHTYDTPGSYTVELYVTDGTDESTEIKENYITVLETLVDPAVGTLYISKVSDAPNFNSSYIEFYNNSSDILSLDNVKLKMIRAIGTTEATFALNNSSYIGDTFILPYSYIIITRGGTKAAFETDFSPLPDGVTFLQGSGNMFFATGTMRRWQVVLDTGAKAEIIIDDTLVPVGGSGNASYPPTPGADWITVPYANLTPGVAPEDQTLPVTLSSFMAVQTSENFAQITWTTESETGLLGYNVFRNELREEDTAYRVNANLIEAENNSVGSSYSYLDEEVEPNTTYYYWLQINEFDGSVSFAGPYQIRIEPDNNSSDVVTPGSTTLNGIYPNPFNPTAAVSFYMGQEDNITLNVYNMKGQLITNLATEKFAEGFHNVVWNGKDANGRDCASGIYFFRMETKSDVQTIKGILMK